MDMLILHHDGNGGYTVIRLTPADSYAERVSTFRDDRCMTPKALIKEARDTDRDVTPTQSMLKMCVAVRYP